MSQNCLRNPHISAIRLMSQFGEVFRAHRVFQDVHTPLRNDLLTVFLSKRDGEFQNSLHEVRQLAVVAHRPVDLVCKRS